MEAKETRHVMKYPYTFTAKLAQFPYKEHWGHYLVKYTIIAAVICLPLMYKIQKLSYSPENVEKWAEIRRKQFHGEH